MDILNFISWIASKRRIVKSLNNSDLLPVGVRNETRDDKYTTVAITAGDFLSQIPIPEPSYKVYTALLTQTGTAAPVATVLEDTIGDISFIYDGVGVYRIVDSLSFDKNKTAIFLGPVHDGYLRNSMYGPGYWAVSTYNNSNVRVDGAPGNLILNNTSIEIRIYN